MEARGEILTVGKEAGEIWLTGDRTGKDEGETEELNMQKRLSAIEIPNCLLLSLQEKMNKMSILQVPWSIRGGAPCLRPLVGSNEGGIA